MNSEVDYVSLFKEATGVSVIDYVDSNDRIVFIVGEGELRKALSGKGLKIRQLSRKLNKKIKVVEYSPDPSKFIENALLPAKLVEPVRITVWSDDRRVAVAKVDPKGKGIAIGKNGRTIELIRSLAKKHHQIDHVIVK